MDSPGGSSPTGDDSSPGVRFVRASAPVCLGRSPYSSYALYVRYVYSDGSLYSNNACVGDRGVRPASVETAIE